MNEISNGVAVWDRTSMKRRGRLVGPCFNPWWRRLLPPFARVAVEAGGEPVSSQRVQERIVGAFPGRILSSTLRPLGHFDDLHYYLPTKAEVEAVFAARRRRGYWEEIYDCEDFAYALKAEFILYRFDTADPASFSRSLAAGILWTGLSDNAGSGHALNLVVTPDDVLLLDSESGEICSAGQWNRSIDYIVI